MKRKILIMHKIPNCGFDKLINSFDIIFPKNDYISEAELNTHLPQTEVIVSVFCIQLNNTIIDKAPYLKLIANFGVGYDNIDVAYASSKGIIVTNTPDPVTEPTAELAMGLMLAVCRNIGFFNNKLRTPDGIKTGVMKNLSTTLTGKTLGIIGMGAIGKALARRALAFNMKIIYHNRNKVDSATEKKYHASWVSLDELLSTSDIISLHTPLTTETHHLINNRNFSLMKKSAFLINTARGNVVNETALIKALETNQIAGAGLDVYENEPLIPKELLNLHNVVLTPHVGTATLETRKEMSMLVSHIILQYNNGLKIDHVVN
jgi:glyoxylate reductase